MPIIEYECENCKERKESIEKIPVRDRIPCTFCVQDGVEMQRILTAHSTYKIKGNNSASVTPKKHRGGRG